MARIRNLALGIMDWALGIVAIAECPVPSAEFPVPSPELFRIPTPNSCMSCFWRVLSAVTAYNEPGTLWGAEAAGYW